MMEKRNFVTSARTPMDGASEIDDIVEAGAAALGGRRRTADAKFEKRASKEDEKTDEAM